MAVVSHLPHDARVWKEVDTLTAAGYRVRLIGMRYDIAAPVNETRKNLFVTEIPLGNRGKARLLGRLKALLSLWLKVVRTRARLYHCHNVHPAPAMLSAARVRRAPFIYDAHELYGEVQREDSRAARLSATVTGLMERVMVKSAAGVVTTNLSRAAVLEKRHGRPDIVVLRNVPALVDNVRLAAPGLPRSRKVLLYQGGIYAETRAFEMTIRALKELPEFDFVIVGFGREGDLELISRWAKEHGVADRVGLRGALPFRDLVPNAAKATVGIVPLRHVSMNSYLGDTNKMFEYLMAGLPVVGSDFPELRRVLTEGDPTVGELFDPEQAESIAQAVRRVTDASHENRRRQARHRAVQAHNWAMEEPRLLSLYDSLLGARAGGCDLRPG